MADQTDDFEGPYNLDAPPASQPPPAGSPMLATPEAAPATTVPTTPIPAWSPANLLPSGLGQWANYEAPTWGQLGQGLLSRGEYIADRAQRGIAERSNWLNQRTDPQTGQTYWLNPYTGERQSRQPLPTPDLPRPDLLTGVAGSVAENFMRNPLLGGLTPMASAAGAATNELLQGFPQGVRNVAGGIAGLATGGGLRDVAHGVSSAAHGIGELLAGHPFRAVGTLASVPGTVLNFIRDPRAWSSAYIAGHTAGISQPSSQPGRVTNQLQQQSQQEY